MRSALPLLACLFGCVPQARYDQALLAYSEAVQGQTTTTETCDAAIAAAEADMDELRAGAQLADGQRAELETALAECRTELSESQATVLAAMEDAGALEASVDDMQQALDELERQREQAAQSAQAYRDLVARFQDLIDAGTLDVRMVDGRMLLQLATDILFTPGSATVSASGREALLEVAGILASDPERRYQVAGHTDNVPINTQRMPSNWYLGAARAIEVVNLLVDGGVAPENVSAASYASHQPVAPNDTADERALNRRIEIVVVPDLSEVPGFEDIVTE